MKGELNNLLLINVSYGLLMNERPLEFNTDTRKSDVANFHSPMNDSGHPLCRCLLSRCGAQGRGRQ